MSLLIEYINIQKLFVFFRENVVFSMFRKAVSRDVPRIIPSQSVSGTTAECLRKIFYQFVLPTHSKQCLFSPTDAPPIPEIENLDVGTLLDRHFKEVAEKRVHSLAYGSAYVGVKGSPILAYANPFLTLNHGCNPEFTYSRSMLWGAHYATEHMTPDELMNFLIRTFSGSNVEKPASSLLFRCGYDHELMPRATREINAITQMFSIPHIMESFVYAYRFVSEKELLIAHFSKIIADFSMTEKVLAETIVAVEKYLEKERIPKHIVPKLFVNIKNKDEGSLVALWEHSYGTT